MGQNSAVVTLERLDPARAGDSDVAALHALDVAAMREAGVPERLVPPAAQGVLDHRHAPAYEHRDVWVARHGGDIVGYGRCDWDDLPSNRHVALLDVHVAPARRGEGLGRRLLAATAEAAAARGCTTLTVEARTRGPAPRFLRAAGFTPRLHTPWNVCLTADVPADLMREWVAASRERAALYELVGWEGRCPDELLDGFVALWPVMNTAPTGDLDWEDEVMTAERWRAMEDDWSARQMTPWTLGARETARGRLVGFTTMVLRARWPAVAEQEDTGVLVEHRNRGLGRLLKASMMLRVMEERPEVEAVSTWNADSNAPMLAINRAMGFRAVEEWAEWQADHDAVRASHRVPSR